MRFACISGSNVDKNGLVYPLFPTHALVFKEKHLLSLQLHVEKNRGAVKCKESFKSILAQTVQGIHPLLEKNASLSIKLKSTYTDVT